MTRTNAIFGRMPDGAGVHAIELANKVGMRARVLTLGASLQMLTAPDRSGSYDDILLGHDALDPYVTTPHFMGAIVGRYANRIAGARFVLGGVQYALNANENGNALHGGAAGFDKAIWRIAAQDARTVTLSLSSADGDQGFPGALEAQATYALGEADNSLTLVLEARCDQRTVVSLAPHGYFNLAGAASAETILSHVLTLAADAYTAVDAALIPTGEIRSVEGSPFDFRTPRAIGAGIADADPQLSLTRGYDHNFVLRGGKLADPRFAVRVHDPRSGRVMELCTTEPGLQFYSGNFLDGSLTGKGGAIYRRGAGLCLEPQHFPNAPNEPAFPSAELRPGDLYRHETIYRFSAE